MDSYTSFAYVYDVFMDQEPYEEWADRVCALMEKYGLPRKTPFRASEGDRFSLNALSAYPTSPQTPIGTSESCLRDGEQKAGDKSLGEELCQPDKEERNIVVDLGCGTGKLTEILAQKGYDMIGIDLSEDMLSIAQERTLESGSGILYTQQDMRSFELYGAAAAMVSVGDSVNYLLGEEDLEAMFRCVERSLLPGGVFVFDFKTVHLYRDVIGESTIAEDREDCAFIWDNYYDEETRINEYDLAVFVAVGGGHGPDSDKGSGEKLFRRFIEVHRQRGYEPEELRQAAEKAGLLWVAELDIETGAAPCGKTERVVAVVKKQET